MLRGVEESFFTPISKQNSLFNAEQAGISLVERY